MITRRRPIKRPESFAAGVGRGLRPAARTGREVARMHGAPIYVWENRKVIAKKPNRGIEGKAIWMLPKVTQRSCGRVSTGKAD